MRKTLFLLGLFTLLLLATSIFAQKTPVDMIVRGGTVVTMNAEKQVIENGAVAVKGGKIVAVGSSAEIAAKYTSRQVVNANGKLVIPGLINTHTHVPMSLFRGLSDDLDLQQWLTQYIFPAEAKNVNEQFVRAGTRLGLAEMIRGGTTTYCDMYYFEDAIAEETSKAGMRGVLGETVIDFPVPDNKTFEAGLSYAEKFIKRWQGDKLIVPAVAPHAPYTVSEEHLKLAKQLSDRLNAPLVIHLAEDPSETTVIEKQKGMRSIQYMAKIGLLSDRMIAAHVIQANDEELQLLKRAGVGIGHNPQSNMKLAAGVARIPEMLAMDMPVGLGTDGSASNNDVNMWEEMDTAAKLHKLISKDPKVASAVQMFEMATIRGARALHLEKITGSLEVGKSADIVIVDTDALNQVPAESVYSLLVYSTKATDVRTVIIEGKLVMRDRVLLTLNEGVVKQEAKFYRQKINLSLKQ
ncbi:MAG TPA: amidohydrolase [Pyrinomonadaceae bacterium]|jgi:5-methylthioadenosine/S-adenosylhomocysteine deaminase|nr:amidohydrolase [Pyrinomonadaceae bacterium]